MRAIRTAQSSIFELFAAHDIGRELQAMSAWLDDHRQVLDWVGTDLNRQGVKATGRAGLPVESVLRCALLKQHRQLSYEELAFHLLDSASFQAFARLPRHWVPKKSALQQAIAAIAASTWERINQVLLGTARVEGIERAERVRIDSTVTDAPIHAPSDSSLLWDGMRVRVRLLEQARELAGAAVIEFVNHRRVAKKRARAIRYTRGAERRLPLYKDLLAVTRATLGYVAQARLQLQLAAVDPVERVAWVGQVDYYRPLIERVIEPTERRVLRGETVPATAKVLSLFEPHTDLIVKGTREVQYGHKLNLSSGRSGMILDVVIEAGNPADAQRFVPMLERSIANGGTVPRQVAADGGYASTANLRQAKALGVQDVAFHKKRGLAVEDRVKSHWVYRQLRNFRAGIEAGISCLKRAFGLARCTWRGLPHFQAYVWSSVLAYNLALFARARMQV